MFSFFFFSSRRRHTRLQGDWSSDVCSSDLKGPPWISTINGYFLEGLKSGGLMIQPCIFLLSRDDSYQISSTCPGRFCASRSALRVVMALAEGLPRVPTAMSPGTSGRVYVVANAPLRATEKALPKL